MKITYLLTTADTAGGTERAVLSQAEQLAGRHDVEVLSVFRQQAEPFFDWGTRIRRRYLVDDTRRPQRPVRESGLDEATCAALARQPSLLVKPEWEGVFNRLTDMEAERALRTIDADVVVTPTPALMALAVQLVPPSVRIVHQEHRVSELRGSSGEPLSLFTPRLDALVTLTDRTREWFASVFGDTAPRLATIPNARPEGFRPRSSRMTKRLVLAGRLVGEKQADHAVKAFAEAVTEHPGWTLRILGTGPMTGRLRGLAQQLGVHDQVELVGGSRHMAEEWAQASVCVLTSRVEAFGLVLTEAQAAGVPIVAYDCPNGPGEIVTDGVDGFLVPPGDIDMLTAALGKLMGDDELRHTLGEAALAAADRFAPERIGRAWEDLYTGLVGGDEAARLSGVQDRVARHAAATGGDGFVATNAPSAASRGGGVAKKAHEVRIEASHPDLTRFGGLVSRVSDDLSIDEVILRNLDLVVDALEGAGIPYVLMRDDLLRRHVGVSMDDRMRVLEALRDRYTDDAVYVSALTKAGSIIDTTVAADLDADRHVRPGAALRVFQPVVTSLQTLHLTGVYGCVVSFWTEDPETSDRVLPNRTLIGDRIPAAAMIPATTRAGSREYTTIEAFTKRFVGDITFPIDVVYTWVDGDDPEWVARKNAVLEASGRPAVAGSSGGARFRSRDELRYSLRSLEMFAPWVRDVYIVTDRQTPDWIDTAHPRVRIVDHRDIFSDPSVLPTFNSHAIESQLHHIDGLAEHFLYMNDDVFFGRAVAPSLFFSGNGQAKFFLSPTAVPMTPVGEGDDFNFSAAKNNRALVEERFGRTITHSFLHAPFAMRRSVLAAMEEEFPEAFAVTAASRTRQRTDHSVASSLHHYYGHFTGDCVPGGIGCAFVNVGLSEQLPRLTRLLGGRPYDVFCLNDFHDGDVPEEEQQRIVHAFLESYFPVASSLETGSVRNLGQRW